VFSGAHTSYLVNYNSAAQTFTLTDQRTGSPDGTDTAIGVENFQFSDGTFASSTFSTPTLIEAFGSTSLTQVGNIYFLYGSGGSGPSLKYLGANITAGQFDAWAPIGAEITATGYQVAWKLAGADQYTVWNTDTNGNDTTNTIGTVSGNSTALETLETSFHQDLNGDGVMGVPAAATTQAAPDIVTSNDTFVFRSDLGMTVNAENAHTIELDALSSFTGNKLAALLHDPQMEHWQTFLQSASDGHDAVINFDNRDSLALANAHVADLHASAVFIR
jgi:serralysin